MNRTYLYPKWLCTCLLLLSTLEMKAQMELEYWFDKYSNPQTVPMSFSEGTISPTLNAEKLSHGIHTVYFRIKDGDVYSPVSSSTFFKFRGTDESVIEYWFEDHADKKNSSPFKYNYGESQFVTLDLSDVDKFPLGVHQLNMRVAAYGGFYSPVYSSLILRLPNGSGDSMLEYWFDDDISKLENWPVSITRGEVQELNLDLSNAANFPLGFHKLNMRIAAYGNQYSPIYSAYVMRLPEGSKSQISYWLDDDYENRRTVVSGKESNGITKLDALLDFSETPSGMHRLMYRITSNGFDDGVVYEVPILVTRQYNQQADVKVIGESHWFDEAVGALSVISDPQSIYTKSYDLDPASFETGQHSFHVQYKNSAGVWSDPNVTYFYKEKNSSRLRAGFISDNTTGIDDMAQAEDFICTYYNGMIFVDCKSSQLGKTGILIVCDMMGRVVARQNVSNSDGIHASVSVENLASQLLIVKLISGNVRYSHKIIKK